MKRTYDPYRLMAAIIFDIPVPEVTAQQRRVAKRATAYVAYTHPKTEEHLRRQGPGL